MIIATKFSRYRAYYMRGGVVSDILCSSTAFLHTVSVMLNKLIMK